MYGNKQFVIFALLIGSIGLAGCPGEEARPAQKPQTQTSSFAAAGKRANPSALLAQRGRPLQKDSPREAFLSTYNNPEQGISFRYPRNYALEEGDVQEHSYFLKRQEDLDNTEPGAVLLATVLIPEDGYPNTTFEHGSLQLVIREGGTEGSCRAAGSRGNDFNGTKLTTVQGVVFAWSEEKSVAGGSELREREYTGFSHGTCYEFLAAVVVEEAPDPEGFKKCADMGRILRQLEKIVSSVQIFEKSRPPATGSSEEIAERL